MNDVCAAADKEVEALLKKAEIVRTQCGDGEMIWQRWGRPTDKPPLLLVHGGFGAWTHWIANVERLSAERLVVTCDMPGQGHSAVAPGEVTAHNIAAPMRHGLNAVIGEGTRFDLAGFSFGGLIGARLAAMVKERCRTYVAVGASGFKGPHVRVEGVRVPEAGMDDADCNAIHRNNLQILMLWDPATIDDRAVCVHRRNVERSRVRSRPLSLSNHSAEALSEITARLGGIWGERDATGGGIAQILRRRDIMHSHQPNSPFIVIEGAGHWVMYERPIDFEEALRIMIDKRE